MKHTPGPWEQSVTRCEIKTVYGRPSMDDSQLRPVMLLGPGVNREANAKLLIAAPGMFLALKAALRALEHLGSGPRPHGAEEEWDQIEEAVMAAETV